MSLNPTSKAAAVVSVVKNVTFLSEAQNVARKILLIGTYDPAKTAVVDEVVVPVFNAAEVADQFGFGSMLHRMAVQAFTGSNGVPTFILPQAEVAGSQATGTITFVVSGLEAGTFHLYIAGLAVPFTVLAGDDETAVAEACVAAITANADLPVTAANTLGVVTVTAKTTGTFGNDISILFNIKSGNTFPTGTTSSVIVAMATGAGIPDITDALNALGTGDNANEDFYTDVVNGYGEDTTTLDIISTYVGAGNEFLGLYSETVGRPFRMLRGDVAPGSAGLTSLIAITDVRKQDRANGVIVVPDSANHPVEIACQAIGHMARINQVRAAQSYINIILIDIDPGDTADRWTSNYDSRDTAVKSGISPTFVASGAVLIQNVMTHYRPDSVPPSSNGYASMRNISILQNIIATIRAAFLAEKWQQISIVANTAQVTNAIDRQKARDTDAVRDELVQQAISMGSKAWLYDSQFTIDKLNDPGAISVRPSTNGFDSTLSVILSGEGGILNNVTEFDTSIAVLLS